MGVDLYRLLRTGGTEVGFAISRVYELVDVVSIPEESTASLAPNLWHRTGTCQ